MAIDPNRRRRINVSINKLTKRARGAMIKAFDTVVREMNKEVHDRLDTPYPPASAPNKDPHKRTGNLQSKTVFNRKGFKVFMQTPNYGVWLDTGTSRGIKPRNWIKRLTIGNKAKLARRINTLAKKFSKK